MDTVSVRELRNHGADVLNRVARGESLVVTRDGVEVAEVVPLRRRTTRTVDLIERRRHLPVVDPAALRRDLDEILDARL